MHVFHGSHLAWCTLKLVRENGAISGDLITEFYSQNPTDFYIKDLGSVLPGLFFALASLGRNPLEYQERLDIDVYDSDKVANHVMEHMPNN